MDSNENVISEKMKNSVVQKDVVHKGKWITTNLVHYTDIKGNMRQWESVGRSTKLDSGVSDAVAIIPVLRRNLYHDCFVLVKQFRPPVGCNTLEFPAGLIGAEDDGPHAAALRELYEETGYRGEICGVVDDFQTPLDPGILETTMTSVCVKINGDVGENIDPKQNLDEGEYVEVVLFPVRDFTVSNLKEWMEKSDSKILIDSRVHAYALGMQMGIALGNKRAKSNIGNIDDSPIIEELSYK